MVAVEHTCGSQAELRAFAYVTIAYFFSDRHLGFFSAEAGCRIQIRAWKLSLFIFVDKTLHGTAAYCVGPIRKGGLYVGHGDCR